MRKLLGLTTALALAFGVSSAKAEGNLYIYNWTDYTSPKLVEKFEAETGIKVTVDTYDSNETLLAKLQSGATGYDLAIPSQHFVEIMIAEDLLVAVDVKGMSNYANVDERWRNPPWDPEQKYSVPWNMGNASFAYRVDLYSGDGSSFKEFFEPNEEVSGRLGVFKAPDEVINMANLYLGIPYCSEDPAEMKRVQDLLMNQKPHVAMYSSEGQNDRLANGEVIMHAHWDGYSMKGRQDGADIAYAFPKEGVVGWFDSLVVPRGAKNVENAEKFMNFLMAPENAALQSNFARYANAIVGSLEYMDEDLKAAPEMNPPQDVPVVFGKACPPKAQKLIDKVWTRLLQ